MFLEELKAEKALLLEISGKAKAEIASSPKGNLRIARSKKRPIYYHRKNPSEREGEYIKASNKALAKALAQKGYAMDALACVEPKLAQLDDLINEYNNNNLARITDAYNSARRELITPYVLNDEEFVKAWLETPFVPNPSHPEHLAFTTADGIKVRSKSEQIIAENLTRLGIPFKYEAPLYYSGGKAVYPDFILLNVRKRSTIYYEHFGKMNEDGYLDYFFWKVKLYNRLGLIPGKDILFTFEDEKHPFDFASHKNMFEMLLL